MAFHTKSQSASLGVLAALSLVAACTANSEPVIYPLLTIQEELRIKNPSVAGKNAQIPGAAMDNNGALYVMDASANQILVFDSTGQFIHHIGKPGDQPGEFLMLGSLGIIGDTVWLADPRLGRITLFSRSGNLLDIMENSEELPAPGIGRYSLLGLLGDGSRLIATTPDVIDPDTKTDRTVPFLRVTSTGKIDTLFQFPIPGAFITRSNSSGSTVVQPFDERPAIGVRRDGGAWVLVDRAAGEKGAASATVTRYSLERGREWSKEILLTATPIPSHLRDSIASAAAMTPEQEKEIKTWLRVPKRLPLVTAAMFSEDGTIWLGESSRSDTMRWVKLDANGEPQGALKLPKSSGILYASTSRLWVLEADSSDISLVRYRIR